MKEALALARRAVVALEAIAQELHVAHGLEADQLHHVNTNNGYMTDGFYILQLRCKKDFFVIPSIAALWLHFQRCQGPFEAWTIDKTTRAKQTT